jgi:hypothetical protein
MSISLVVLLGGRTAVRPLSMDPGVLDDPNRPTRIVEFVRRSRTSMVVQERFRWMGRAP